MGDERVNVIIRDKSALYSAYMPFVKNGGLFIASNRPFTLGETLDLTITLLEEKDSISISGTVIWVTPKGVSGNRSAGVGVQFDEKEGPFLRNKFETLLAGMLQSDKSTQTM